jgi:hypothetical protein
MTNRAASASGIPDVPEVLPLRLPSAIAAEFGVSATAVRTAMHDGRLRYYIAWGATSATHLIDPEDAAKLWPKRRRPWSPPVFDGDP